MANLSIVIATKDRPAPLRKCLLAISKQTRKPSDIIIVDGSSKPFAKKDFAHLNGIKIVYKNEKSSMVEARNIGVGCAEGDIVLFLDDDAFIERNYVKELLQFYETHTEAGGAEGNITNENGRRILDRILNFPHLLGRNDIMRVHGLHGCNMSFRKTVFSNFVFDENLIGYYNDDDEFCGRVAKKYKLFFVPNARLIHDQTQYGGARIDHYTNYNTLVFNQFYSLTRIQEKNIFDILCYLFSQIVMILRAFIFIKADKHMAIKGIVRGYNRIFRGVLKGNLTEEIRKL